MSEHVAGEFQAALDALQALCADRAAAERVDEVAGVIVEALGRGGRILACGNGGSCADAMHFCEELTGRYRDDRPSIGAIACTDPGHLTCTANDFGFESVFSRWVEGVGRTGDVLVVLSTSGNSPNIVAAVDQARASSISTVALLGRTGGELRGQCDHEWVVPGETADRIQELHMLILHALVGAIERGLA